nr:PREDICTED: tetraspanin-10 [Lepisosteus oculatus]
MRGYMASVRSPFSWMKRNESQNDEKSFLIPKGDGDKEPLGANAYTDPGESYEGRMQDQQSTSTHSDTEGQTEARASLFSRLIERAGLGSRGRPKKPALLDKTTLASQDFVFFGPPQDHKHSSLTSRCLKYLLFSSNFIFTLLGLLALAIGLWGLVDKESFSQEKIGHIGTDPMLIFVTLGLVLSLLCLTGCVGALRENQCLLRTFSLGVLVLVTLQVLSSIVAYTLRNQIEGYLRSGMLTALGRYQDDLDLRFIMDEIQIGLQCCGADSYRDWELNMYFNCSAPGVQACGVPASCCIDPLENGTVWNSQCGLGAQLLDEFSAQSVIYLGGCLGGISRWIRQHTGITGMVGIVLLGVQILSLFIAMHLVDDIQKSKTYLQASM